MTHRYFTAPKAALLHATDVPLDPNEYVKAQLVLVREAEHAVCINHLEVSDARGVVRRSFEDGANHDRLARRCFSNRVVAS